MKPDYEKAGSWPSDAVEITSEQYAALLEGQSNGQHIVGDENGFPILITPEPHVPTQEEIQNLRKAAYAAESDPLYFKAQRGEATQEEWLAKVQEIKNRYPDPSEAQV